jgi:HNH endonuclease
MPKIILTQAAKDYIAANRLTTSGVDMASHIGCSKTIVNRYMRINGLAVSQSLKNQFKKEALLKKHSKTLHPFDDEIKQHYLTTPVKALATQLGKSHTYVRHRIERLGLTIPAEIIEKRKIIARFGTGHVSANKGKKQHEYLTPEQIVRASKAQFKKGQLPHNTKPGNGHITIRHYDANGQNIPYYYIKLSHGKWYPLHQHLWAQAHGPQPPKHCVVFKNGNTLNCVIENLELITMSENAIRNKQKFLSYPTELQELISTSNKLSKILKQKK